MTDVVRVGLLGCGNVGAALVRLLDANADLITQRVGRAARGRAGSRCRTSPRSATSTFAAGVLTNDADAVVTDPEIDVVVEVIGGVEPARSLILTALKSGKPVVTANKELLANFGEELFEAAETAGVDLLFEASVAGGIPLIRPLRESLAGERITPRDGHRERHDQLRAHPDDRRGLELLGRGRGGAGARLRGARSRPPTSTGSTRRRRRRSSRSIAFGARIVAGDVYREGITQDHRRRHRARRRSSATS